MSDSNKTRNEMTRVGLRNDGIISIWPRGWGAKTRASTGLACLLSTKPEWGNDAWLCVCVCRHRIQKRRGEGEKRARAQALCVSTSFLPFNPTPSTLLFLSSVLFSLVNWWWFPSRLMAKVTRVVSPGWAGPLLSRSREVEVEEEEEEEKEEQGGVGGNKQ